MQNGVYKNNKSHKQTFKSCVFDKFIGLGSKYSVVKYFESYFKDGFTLSFKFNFCFIKSCFCPRTVFLF